MSDTSIPFGGVDDAPLVRPEKRFPHPVAVFFHLLFRSLALLGFLFCNWLSSSFVASFVVLLLLLSADFWTVKNVSGRLLVGLRWWNYVDGDGKSRWVYEARPAGFAAGSVTESRLFWVSLAVAQLLWLLFLFAMLFTLNLKWLMVVVVGFVMNGANAYGYVRCRIGAKKDMGGAAREFLGRAALRGVLSGMNATEGSGTGATGAGQSGEAPR